MVSNRNGKFVNCERFRPLLDDHIITASNLKTTDLPTSQCQTLSNNVVHLIMS